jgi:hypothetical protein
MKTPKTSSNSRRVVVIALLAATTIVTVGMAVVVPASIVKPAYAELDISEQIIGEEIPESDAIREKVGEITSQFLPTLPEQATLLFVPRPPPALAD